MKILFAVVVALASVACGGAESGQEPSPSDSPANAAAEATPPVQAESIRPATYCSNSQCNNSCRACGARSGSCTAQGSCQCAGVCQ